MNFIVRCIGLEYIEVSVDEIDTGTMDQNEAISLAQKMVSAAEDILYKSGLRSISDACGTIVEDLSEHV